MTGPIPAWPAQPRQPRRHPWRRALLAAIAAVSIAAWFHREHGPAPAGTVDYCAAAFDDHVESGTPIPDSCTGAFGG